MDFGIGEAILSAWVIFNAGLATAVLASMGLGFALWKLAVVPREYHAKQAYIQKKNNRIAEQNKRYKTPRIRRFVVSVGLIALIFMFVSLFFIGIWEQYS